MFSILFSSGKEWRLLPSFLSLLPPYDVMFSANTKCEKLEVFIKPIAIPKCSEKVQAETLLFLH